MKTLLTCFVILCLAVLIGKLQGRRIENLERTIEANRSQQSMKVSFRENNEKATSYRSKYEKRTRGASPSEVFEVLVANIMGSTSGLSGIGPGADPKQREALQKVMQLNFGEIQALMDSVYESEELGKEWPRQHMAANLCMLAMIDADPSGALRYVMEDEGWNRLFNEKRIPDGQMVEYILTRMAVDDPQLSVDSMWSLEKTRKALSSDAKGKVMVEVMKGDPDLAFKTIVELPQAEQQSVLTMASFGLDTEDEFAAFFAAARDRLSSKPKLLKWVLSYVIRRSRHSTGAVKESQTWLEGLKMRDSEKQLILEGLEDGSAETYEIEKPEDIRWIASLLPQSSEAQEILWYLALDVYPNAPEKAFELAVEVGVDPAEQMRLDEEAALESDD